MPHPSNPLDDLRARSFNREHVHPRGGLDEVWFVLSSSPFAVAMRTSQRVGRLSDGFFLFPVLPLFWYACRARVVRRYCTRFGRSFGAAMESVFAQCLPFGTVYACKVS
ncbi:hypothetical protein PLICRDRAFT_458303 [Plicaturopsis crispa FD-325 SS-3]|nr:hypothetical protein PLICRDRAFT_458303 [Plicaturopsis crispa FD-325 SS-3]